MILIPQRLFGEKNVKTILREGNVCILTKELTNSLINREGYITNHVVSIVLSGEQKITTYDNDIISVKENETLFIPRGMYQVSDLMSKSGGFKSMLFYFDDEIISQFLTTIKVTEISKHQVPDHLKFGNVSSIKTFAESILNVYDGNNITDKRFLNLKILELLHLLNAQAKEQNFANFLFRLTLPQKRNIKSFMEHNYNKPLKMEDYAYLTGRSVSTFRRDFKSYFSITPQKWLKEKRLDKALELFKNSQASVTEVAYEVGYENISYFIKEFKSKVGFSPKQYLLHQRRNEFRN